MRRYDLAFLEKRLQHTRASKHVLPTVLSLLARIWRLWFLYLFPHIPSPSSSTQAVLLIAAFILSTMILAKLPNTESPLGFLVSAGCDVGIRWFGLLGAFAL